MARKLETKLRFLSYAMGSAIPVYGMPNARPVLKRLKSFENGDSSRSYRLDIQNHWGTHVDAPAHFFRRGRRVSSYPANFWRFTSPQVLNVRLGPGQLLSRRHLEGNIKKKADLVLIQSGWWKKRGRSEYCLKNPGVDAEAGLWLRKHCPHVRAIGFDWVSLSSYLKREEGRAAHRAFLDPLGEGSSILILEDMDLSGRLENLKEVWALPLRVEELDSAPCTVVGKFTDR